MTPFTVYLVMRNTPDTNRAQLMDRRLRSLRALHDELLAVGIRVTPLPDLADLEVEITNVSVAGEGRAPSHAETTIRAERGHILSIRLSVSGERVELVCSDGTGRETAEHFAAQRILIWLDQSSRPRMTDLAHAPTA